MNIFYNQHIVVQWAVAIVLGIIGFLPALYIGFEGVNNPLVYLLFFIYLPLGQFCLTPIFRLTGMYRYYSPMLLGYAPSDKHIDLHNGTSFDYLFVFGLQKDSRSSLRARIMGFHFQGLLKIIDRIENEEIPESVLISGTSYFFNERTAKKLGFSIEPPSTFYRLNVYANFIDIFWMYSLAQGRLVFPAIRDVKKIETTGRTLVDHKDVIQRYAGFLAKKL